MTRYYRDTDGAYLGGFDGESVKIPAGAIEVQNPPNHGLDTWVNGTWAASVDFTRKVAKEALQKGLLNMSLDIGSDRIIQTRPQDHQNMLAKIEVINAGGSDKFIMSDNTVHSVTVAELQQAILHGITQGSILYDVYMGVL